MKSLHYIQLLKIGIPGTHVGTSNLVIEFSTQLLVRTLLCNYINMQNISPLLSTQKRTQMSTTESQIKLSSKMTTSTCLVSCIPISHITVLGIPLMNVADRTRELCNMNFLYVTMLAYNPVFCFVFSFRHKMDSQLTFTIQQDLPLSLWKILKRCLFRPTTSSLFFFFFFLKTHVIQRFWHLNQKLSHI